jgi:hypothetical protein
VILDALQNSVITRMELSYHGRKETQHGHWRRRVYIVVMTLLAIFSIVAGVMKLSFGLPNTDVVRLVLIFFYWMLVALHFGLLLSTLHLSSAAITRDKRDTERWEALLLTGVSGREIVWGKWWATVQTMSHDYLLLAFWRAAAVFTLFNIGIDLLPTLGDAPSTITIQSNLWSILAGVGVVTVFTLANLPYTAAVGVMAAMDTKQVSGLVRSLAGRTVFTILAAIIPLVLWYFIGYGLLLHSGVINRVQELDISSMFREYANTFLDNGFSISGYLVVNPNWLQRNMVGTFAGLGMALASYGGLTWVLLRIAQWRAERTGALRTLETKGKTA